MVIGYDLFTKCTAEQVNCENILKNFDDLCKKTDPISYLAYWYETNLDNKSFSNILLAYDDVLHCYRTGCKNLYIIMCNNMIALLKYVYDKFNAMQVSQFMSDCISNGIIRIIGQPNTGQVVNY